MLLALHALLCLLLQMLMVTSTSFVPCIFTSLKCSYEILMIVKGTVSRDLLLLVFFMNKFPLRPRVLHLDRFDFFRKFAEIFASQGAPPVSTTPVANLPPVSTTPAAKTMRLIVG
jgi:hypothetical protein